ncbi:lysylphosphatidylglycerol synthase transmembrane domain-containing protein [Haliea sp. E1-2-M8]|uniref:lysylphosphatidylglycerol synthase transmembrane domain-containing protein n=1 Tax=Haliea sp. E1-2-M8 TaxID=3064706 RepID=UPI0027191FFE|nr:lysylphosphatidylglycerol synthase transmembrane domain-containing protein [Haliea sp. E1-2-M8]MDO8863463.1 lysylphosphatidylglycerol synthase transmembrane domain-containing protein [Haliea sp. E1-2-M8]
MTLPVNPFKIIGFAVLFVLLSALVPVTIVKELNGQFDLLWRELFTPRFIVSALALLTVYYVSDGLRLWFTLRSLGQHQPLRTMLPLVFINLLFSNITPMATGGGVVQVWYLHRRGIHIGAATAATTVRTLLSSLMIFLPAPVLLFSIDRLVDSPLASQWGGWLGLFAVLYVAFFLLLLWRLRWFIHAATAVLALAHRLHLIGESRQRRWRFRLRREMIRFGYSFQAFFKGNLADLVLALVSTAIFLTSLFSFPALLLWGMGSPVDYPLILALMLVNTFIMYFAPTPGAAGIAEGVFAVIFTSLLESGDLLLLVLGWRFLTVHLGMLIGVPVSIYAFARRKDSHG